MKRNLQHVIPKLDSVAPCRNSSAFTLIEMSIVLVIIGLIVGGVLVGRDMIEAAQIRKTITQHEQFLTAINAFKAKFNGMPGDLANASAFFSGVTNGNNNGVVDYGNASATLPGEVLQFWYQLSLAGFIRDSMTGQVDASNNMVAGLNIPASVISNTAGWNFYKRDYNPTITVYGRKGQAFELGNCPDYWPQSEIICPGPVMTTLQAKSLDIKIDDGLADSGQVFGTQAVNSSGTGFLNGCGGAWSASSGSYDLSVTTLSCRLFFWY